MRSLSVCLSVKSHLVYGASVRPENAVKYSVCNIGGNICGIFTEAIERYIHQAEVVSSL